MKTKIQATVSIVKVAQDHVNEIRTKYSNDEMAREIIDDIEVGLNWLLKKLDKLNAMAHTRETKV